MKSHGVALHFVLIIRTTSRAVYLCAHRFKAFIGGSLIQTSHAPPTHTTHHTHTHTHTHTAGSIRHAKRYRHMYMRAGGEECICHNNHHLLIVSHVQRTLYASPQSQTHVDIPAPTTRRAFGVRGLYSGLSVNLIGSGSAWGRWDPRPHVPGLFTDVDID